MIIEEIEKLIDIIRDAKISELTVATGNPRTTVTIRKALAPEPTPKKSVNPLNKKTKAAKEEPAADNTIHVTAPMVGIFHSTGDMLEEGCAVRIGQQVGTIESMKLMNDIISEYEGSIAEVMVEDGMPVEYGQNLLRLEIKG